MTHPYEPPMRNRKAPEMIDLSNPNNTPWKDCTAEWRAEFVRQENAGAEVEVAWGGHWRQTDMPAQGRCDDTYRILKPVLPPLVPILATGNQPSLAPAPWHPETNTTMWGELTPDQQDQLRAAKHGLLFCNRDGNWFEVNEGPHRFPGRVYRAKPAPKPNLIKRLRNTGAEGGPWLETVVALLAADELIRSTGNKALIAKWEAKL